MSECASKEIGKLTNHNHNNDHFIIIVCTLHCTGGNQDFKIRQRAVKYKYPIKHIYKLDPSSPQKCS